METTPQPYRVSSKVDAAILQSDAIPVFGHTAPFPWEQLTANIAQKLELEGLELKPSEFSWLDADAVAKDLGEPLNPVVLRCNGLEGHAHWLMSMDHTHQLLAWILTKRTDPLGVPDEEFRAGLRKFLALELCHCLDQLNYAEGKHPQLTEETSLPSEGPLLCCDINISYSDQHVLGRVAFDASFVKSWRDKMGRQMINEVPAERAAEIPLSAALVVGGLSIGQKQWKAVKAGDFLIPDNCFLELDSESGKARGHAVLKVNGMAVAHARIRRNGKVEIIQSTQG